MRKLFNRILLCLLAAAMFYTGGLICDRRRLDQELCRLHVVANSDSPEDQAIKLQVRDAVAESLRTALDQATDAGAARDYLQAHLGQIEAAANETLRRLDAPYRAAVTFRQEQFDAREADGFSLPAGIYQALRVTIGNGEGHNWWGVLYPQLFADEDVPVSLSDSLAGDGQVRFFLLDQLGKVQNYLAGKDLPSVFQQHSVVE